MFEDITGNKKKKKFIHIDLDVPCPSCGQQDSCVVVRATGTTRGQWMCECWHCGHVWIMDYKEAGV